MTGSVEKRLNRIMVIGAVAIVASLLFTVNVEFEDKKSEVFQKEEVYCLEALCLRDNTVGHSCLELDPRMVKVIVTEDTPGISRIIIEANNTEKCG